MEDYDFQSDVEIMPDALDIEWLGMANLTLKYGKMSEESKKKMDRLKARQKEVLAEVELDIRNQFKDENPKEGFIKAKVTLDKRSKKAEANLIKAKYEAGLYKVMVDSMDTKKTSLENLVRLHGREYFAGPREPKELSDRSKSITKYAQENRRRRVTEKTRKAKNDRS